MEGCVINLIKKINGLIIASETLINYDPKLQYTFVRCLLGFLYTFLWAYIALLFRFLLLGPFVNFL